MQNRVQWEKTTVWLDDVRYSRIHLELSQCSLEEKVKTSTRDSVIYYWSTRRFLEFFFFVFMHFCLDALFQANSMQKFIKIPLIPSVSNKYQKKI